MRIKHRAAVITAAAVLAAAGATASYAATAAGAAGTVSVPNSGGQLTGTVDICVNTADESQSYTELGHPAPGNCRAGYLQYAVSQSGAAAGPAALVNSETFTSTAAVPDKFTVHIPKGSHLAGTVTATDLNSNPKAPDTVTVTYADTVTGEVDVTYSAGTPGHLIQLTYSYSG